tara:strand:- start:2415 stop:2687 length:273 start_codon:yes stop_codon:yes gene_type:complete
MERKNFSDMSDQELLIEKKKHHKSKLFHAVLIGFLAGILIFGLVAWLLSPEKKLGFFIPMLFPIIFLYKLFNNPKGNRDLEEVLKERNLD